MTATRRVLLFLVIGVTLLASAAVDLAHAESADDVGRPAADVAAAAAVVRAAAPQAAGTAPVESTAALRQVESTMGVSDIVGDAMFPQADLTAAGASSDEQGLTVMVAIVSTFETPFSASWQFRDTALLWGFDTDGDGDEDVSAILVNYGGELVGGLVDASGRLVCDATPFSDASRRAYGLGFPTSCLGDPESYRFYASMHYVDYTTAISSVDEVPDTTWSYPVDNDARGSSTVTYSACETSVDPAQAPASADAGFRAISPARLLDTREGMSTIDCMSAGIGALQGGEVYELDVAGRGEIPAGATAVALNLTATDAAGAGFVTVYPCGQTRPLASNLNVTAGETVANAVLVQVGAGGAICLFSSIETDLVIDANGWFGTTSSFVSAMPTRVLDTRNTGVVRPAGSITRLAAGSPTTTSAPVTAVVLNVTVTEPQSAGFVTVFPCDRPIPLASNLNFTAGQTVANAVVAKVADDGTVCVFTSAAAHLVADRSGWFTGITDLVTLTPARVFDSRPGLGTIDGESAGSGLRTGGAVTAVQVTGRGGVPVGATAVILNVTVTDARGAGYVTVFPCGSGQPNASNLNFAAGATRANAVVAKVGANGTVCVASNVDTHLVVDVAGYGA